MGRWKTEKGFPPMKIKKKKKKASYISTLTITQWASFYC